MKKVIDRNKAEKNLGKKGFRREEDRDHVYYYTSDPQRTYRSR